MDMVETVEDSYGHIMTGFISAAAAVDGTLLLRILMELHKYFINVRITGYPVLTGLAPVCVFTQKIVKI